jgi:hypothetical protein
VDHRSGQDNVRERRFLVLPGLRRQSDCTNPVPFHACSVYFFLYPKTKEKTVKERIFCKSGEVYWYINEKLGYRNKINCTNKKMLK